MKIIDFNLENINSQLLNNMDSIDRNLEVFINIDQSTLDDFNKRVINPQNVNKIIEILDYFLVIDDDNFIIKYSTPTLELYQIDKLKCKKDGQEIEEEKVKLPTFMIKGIDKSNYKYNWSCDDIHHNHPRDCLEDMAYHGCLNWIKFVIEDCKYTFDNTNNLISFWAAHGNHIDLIKYLDENNISKIDKHTLYGVVSSGNEEITSYILTKTKSDYKGCSYAASGGNVKCLQLCYENNNDWDLSTFVNAASSGSLECMKYAFENGCSFTEGKEKSYEYYKIMACEAAAAENNIECFKFAYSNGCPLGSALANAFRYDNLEMAKVIWSSIKREEITDYEFEILSRICIKNNNLETLKYAYEVIKSPLDGYEGFMYNISMKESGHATEKACLFDNIEMLEYLLKNGMELHESCLEEAIGNNSIKLVEYILSLDEKINKEAVEYVKDDECEIAFLYNNYEVLEYFYNKGYNVGDRWKPCIRNIDDDERCWNFAKKHKITFIDSNLNYDRRYWLDSYELLNKSKEFNFNWNEDLPALMASHGNIDRLKYLHENGCPWDNKTTLNSCYFERYSGRLLISYDDNVMNFFDCLKYALENNCPLHDDCLDYAIISNDMIIIEYLLNNNCLIKDNIFDQVIIKIKNNQNMFKIFEILFKHDLKFTLDNLKTAISLKEENIELVQFIINKLSENKIKLTNDIFNSCIEAVSLNILKLLSQYNCPYDSDCYIHIFKKNNYSNKYNIEEDRYLEFIKNVDQLNINKNINLDCHLEENNNRILKNSITTFLLRNEYKCIIEYIKTTKDTLYLRTTLGKLDKNEKYYNLVEDRLNEVESMWALNNDDGDY
jgi:hypothetical protein